jgi:hypothetical protein
MFEHIGFRYVATPPQFKYLCHPFGERHAFIASKSKELPRGACHDSDVAEESEDQDEGCHGIRRGERSGYVVEDLDVRVTRWC